MFSGRGNATSETIELVMQDENSERRELARGDTRECSMCHRRVATADGVYVGGGRWCCFPCAAALYWDGDDEEGEDEKK